MLNLKTRICKGKEYKLYPNGDVYRGIHLVDTIKDDEIMDWIQGLRYSTRAQKKYLDTCLSKGVEYIRSEMMSKQLVSLKIIEDLHETKIEDEVYCPQHRYFLLDRLSEGYLMCCCYCLKQELLTNETNTGKAKA